MKTYSEALRYLAEQRVHGTHVLNKRRVNQAGELILISFLFEKDLSAVESDFNQAYRAATIKHLQCLNTPT